MNSNIASYIDHTLLKADSTREQIAALCKEALDFGFYSVCINPVHVSYAAELLDSTDVKICSVVSFPFGACTTEVKVFETTNSIIAGAHEVDMVINIGALKYKQYDVVQRDIKAVVDTAISNDAIVKVILETCYLTPQEIIIACEICKSTGAHFVKTSTGFGPQGATPEIVSLMRQTVGDTMGVKAAGGIRDYKTALSMIEAGANRLGTSASILICREAIMNG